MATAKTLRKPSRLERSPAAVAYARAEDRKISLGELQRYAKRLSTSRGPVKQ